jgi:hypothetical protein
MKKTVIFVLACWLVGCGKVDDAMNSANQVPPKLDDMQNSMDELKRKMTLEASFEALLKPEYGKNLQPIPYDMMAFAKEIPKVATSDEFIQLVDLWIRKMNDATAPNPPTAPDAPKEGATDIDKSIYAQTMAQQKIQADQQSAAYTQQQMQTFVALQAVCGFLEDSQVQEIITDQIYKDGEFKETAYQLLLLRQQFLQNIEVAQLIQPKTMNAGVLDSGVKYVTSIEQITQQPFASKMTLNVTGIPGQQINLTLDTTSALQDWQMLKDNAARDLQTADVQSLTGNKAQDLALHNANQARVTQLLSIVNQHIAALTPKAKP